MTIDKKWKHFQDYIADRLKEIDSYCRSTIGSGNQGESGDIFFSKNLGLHIECKLRNTKNVTIMMNVWKKNCSEIPLNVNKIPLLALENKDGKRFAVLELDDFLDMFIQLYKLKNGD